ncbi:sensor histidine kinase [Demetria terragena]|uniref:sensor histidine kinase n=1 Tax=Demetria terragena TaxID=63959 RepID=UPI00037C47A9|nr:histidine kinase [Demetria terragena]
MMTWRAWWDQLSHHARFRLYTRVTLQVSIIAIAAAILIGGWAELHRLSAGIGLAVASFAGCVVLETQPLLASQERRARSTGLRWGCVAVLVTTWAAVAIVLLTDPEGPTLASSGMLVIFGAMVITLVALAFHPYAWSTTLGVALVSAAAFSRVSDNLILTAVSLVAATSFMLLTGRLSLWALDLMSSLERTKDLEAQLAAAEQRLRFGRDLHDVVGRGFSAITVKSELAATLSRAGATDQATAEMEEVKALAASSLEEMRGLVRGYRAPSLAQEVDGAKSLLLAAGCELQLQGSTDAVPPDLHQVAAWVVREGTTNIVKHSRATAATLTLGPAGMALSNDGAWQPPGEHSGLSGLSERLAEADAALTTSHNPSTSTFSLEIHWKRT